MTGDLPAPTRWPASHPSFPEELRQADPPVRGLWVRGRAPAALGRRVAIIGSRDATSYGLEIARGLAADLAGQGVCIVSGMARGCDGEAHRGALSVGGTTIAVLATGVDIPYPDRNRRLYEEIVARGAVVSERPLGAGAHRHHFMERNRIIAGLAEGLVVVQGRVKKSGARSTLGFADDMGVTTFAVPGDVRSSLSGLPHEMLRTGSVVCASAGDVLSELALGGASREPHALPAGLPPDQLAVAEALARGPASPAVLAHRCDRDLPEVLRALTKLELRGLVARAGASYVRREGP